MPSWTSWPTGYCIQQFAERIQKAENSVPMATTNGGGHVQPGRHPLRQPNSITPRKVASRKKALSTS